MVRLVFRPYTRVGRSICTSEPRRSSTRVSSGFNLPGHSSPSFGSRPIRSRSLQPARWCLEGPVVRSLLERERSHLGIDKRLLCFRSALGFFNPSDSRMGQTPRSVFQDGSAEVPTSAWGITPPRIGTAGKHATAVERGRPETSPSPVELPRRPASPSSPLGDGWANSSVPAAANEREGTSQRCRNIPTTFPRDFKRSENRSPRGPP